MTSGLSNKEKAAVRQQFAEGKVGRDALLEAESAAYHGEGTCTFYGTANSNQMLMETSVKKIFTVIVTRERQTRNGMLDGFVNTNPPKFVPTITTVFHFV